MKKKVKIYESEIKRAVRRGVMENIFEQHEMKDTYSKAKYHKSPREAGIEGVFGQYGEEIPASVLRYMRKNPKVIIKRLYDVYGQQMFDYISQNLSTPDVDIEVADEEVVVDETLIKIPADKYKEDMKFPEDSTVEITEDKPSKGLSKKKKSDVVKKARRGGDIGKKGKNFDKIANKAAKRYGSKEAGERVAAAAMWKNINRG